MLNNKRTILNSGLQKVDTAKIRYDLIPSELLTRLAEHYTKSLEKYPEDNWKKATKEESRKIFIPSAWRHFISWTRGDKDEDHGIALIWNIISYIWINEYKKNGK